MGAESERVDKWLWMVRVFKTRSLAIDCCRNERVTVNGVPVKASHTVQLNDLVAVRKPPVTLTFRVKGFPGSRIGAKLVDEYAENLTPPEEYQKLDPSFRAFSIYRNPGTGRPTKKERRSLDDFFDSEADDSPWDADDSN
ncbi:MAG TPA: RNA-binding S4 domain-containing protein [Tenuifilaceae bacterium]|jgi:ribosome-associated heat shock protein Hsp15|nr:RNA-binding S4 domain-containing protein [Bacteroidales bacterium]HNT41390.1 RNA-binding S4 domain-containing protein [Tenuifilaceae bacterium]MBP8643553.1 RNA-binding S4 domain-containing protein [Bacteroidales bacterium]NLI88659.1 RNA-binding S4 domain-containing protein [Bacteroidales bacterium]HNY08557.1 RNA-binding S4 domain-containing protein [Tenuifilaceae bacterium]